MKDYIYYRGIKYHYSCKCQYKLIISMIYKNEIEYERYIHLSK